MSAYMMHGKWLYLTVINPSTNDHAVKIHIGCCHCNTVTAFLFSFFFSFRALIFKTQILLSSQELSCWHTQCQENKKYMKNMKKEHFTVLSFYFIHPTFDNDIIAATVIMRTSTKQHTLKKEDGLCKWHWTFYSGWSHSCCCSSNILTLRCFSLMW